MWPWGHLAFGYILYSLGSRLAVGRPPQTLATVIALSVGTQFPDLVDKPLAWWLGVIPNGRSLAHSVFTFVLISVAAYLLARRIQRRVPVGAFSFGYLSHIVGDALPAVIRNDAEGTLFFLWPLVPAVEYPTGKSLFAHLANVELTPLFAAQLLMAALVTGLWWVDGRPGWLDARSASRRVVRELRRS
jgi:hypothetical protein